MKIALIIVRTLLGLLFVFSSVVYFSNLIQPPELTGAMKTFNDGVNAAGYLMPLVKATELICGLAFIAGRFVPLASLVILPISINILGVHTFVAPEGLPIAIFVMLATVFLIYSNRKHYKGLLVAKS